MVGEQRNTNNDLFSNIKYADIQLNDNNSASNTVSFQPLKHKDLWIKIFTNSDTPTGNINLSKLQHNINAINTEIPDNLKQENGTDLKIPEFQSKRCTTSNNWFSSGSYTTSKGFYESEIDDIFGTFLNLLEKSEYNEYSVNHKRLTFRTNKNLCKEFKEEIIDPFFAKSNILNNDPVFTQITKQYIDNIKNIDTNYMKNNFVKTTAKSILSFKPQMNRISLLEPVNHSGTGEKLYAKDFTSKAIAYYKAFLATQTFLNNLQEYHAVKVHELHATALQGTILMSKGSEYLKQVHVISLKMKELENLIKNIERENANIYTCLQKSKQIFFDHVFKASLTISSSSSIKAALISMLNSIRERKVRFTDQESEQRILYAKIYTLLEGFNATQDKWEQSLMMQKILSYFFEKSLEEENAFLNSCDEANMNKEEIRQMIQTQLDQMVDCFTVDKDIVTNQDNLQVYLTDGSDNKGVKQIKMSQGLEYYLEITNDAIEKYIDKKFDEEKEMKELHVGQLKELRNIYDITLSKFPTNTNTAHLTQERDDVMREYVTREMSDKLQHIIRIVEKDIKSKQALLNTINTEINSFEPEIKDMHDHGIIPTDDNQKRKLETYQQYLNAQVNITNQMLQLEEKKQEYVVQINQLETYPIDNLENLIRSEYLEKNAQKSILINNNLLIQALIPSHQQNSTAIIRLTNNNDLILSTSDCCKTFKDILKHYIAFYTGLSTIEQFHSYNTAVSNGVRDNNNILNLLSSFSNKNKEIKQTEIDTVLSEFLARSKINCDTQNNTKPLIQAKKTTYNIANNVCIKSGEILDKLNNIENNISNVINKTETLKQTFDTEYTNNATPAILDKKNEAIKYYYKVLEINNSILKIKAIINKLLYKTNNKKTRIQNVSSINEIKMNFVRSILSLCVETKETIDDLKNKIGQLKNNNAHNENKLDAYRDIFNNLIDNTYNSLNTDVITLLNNQISEIDVIIRNGITSTDNNFSTDNLNNENILDSIRNNLVVIANNSDAHDTATRTRISQNKYDFITVNDELLLLQKQKEIMSRISQIGLKNNNLPAVYVLTKYDGLKTQEENNILHTLCEYCESTNMPQQSVKVDLFTPYNIHNYTAQILEDARYKRNIHMLKLQYSNDELRKKLEYENILKNHSNNNGNSNNNSSTPTIYTGNIYNTNAT